MSETIEVTEKMGKLIDWVNGLGEEETRRRIRKKICELRDMPKNTQDKDGFFWDIRLEPNDGSDQYRHGGDCNLCKRKEYCGTQCGANKALKKITTSLLYQMYMDENPEAAAEEAAKRITPQDVLNMVGDKDAEFFISR